MAIDNNRTKKFRFIKTHTENYVKYVKILNHLITSAFIFNPEIAH